MSTTTLSDQETEQITVPATVTLKPDAWTVYSGATRIGHVSQSAPDYYMAQWLPYGKGHGSSHATRDEAVAAVIAGGAA